MTEWLRKSCLGSRVHVLLAAGLVWFAGCGGDSGPPRFPISGSVTFNGAPIPFGEIIFEPDGEANNKGPSTRLPIVDGAYTSKTKKAVGTIGGAMIVRITGTDGKESGTQTKGAPLFKEYIEKIELPKMESTQNFDVPGKK